MRELNQDLDNAVALAVSMTNMTVHADVGTLPLLAALAVGIAVAVVAAIAFLQLTARGREGRKASGRVSEDGYAQLQAEEEWQNDEENDQLEEAFADYTVPITMTLPDAGERATGEEPRLCGVSGEHAGSSYRVLGRKLSIGRDPGQCGIIFPYDSLEISRKHCTVSYDEQDGVFMLEDHGSANGTFLNDGEQLEPGKVYYLKTGERFSLSASRHWFEVRGD